MCISGSSATLFPARRVNGDVQDASMCISKTSFLNTAVFVVELRTLKLLVSTLLIRAVSLVLVPGLTALIHVHYRVTQDRVLRVGFSCVGCLVTVPMTLQRQ